MASLHKIILGLLILLSVPVCTQAATLSIIPISETRTIGETFPVQIVVSSTDQAMNAASGVLSFPSNMLEVVSVSKNGSVFSFWPVEPTFSNAVGTVNFEGVVLNPGYQGSSGVILTVMFRGKAEGQAQMVFSSGSVLANDGLGTNILKGLQASQINVSVPRGVVTPVVTEPVRAVNTNALNITSRTHPDQTAWYMDTTPEFSWVLPPNALETRTYISKSETSIPMVSYIPAISEKKVDELPDGTYYFSVQVRTSAGWGDISRYKVNIDSTPPKPFTITFPHGSSTFEPQPVIYFNTTDEKSGISHYDIRIGQANKPDRVSPIAMSNPYVVPPQTPGTYELVVTAIDGAGNTRSTTSEFTVEGIDVPAISYYPETMEVGDIFKVRGTTYENSDVYVTIYENGAEVWQDYSRSNALGDFSVIITKKLDIGTYTFTVYVQDGRGARSKESDPLPVTVQGNVLHNLLDTALGYLSIAILVILACGGLVWLLIGVGCKIVKSYRKSCKAISVGSVSAEAFNLLRNDIANHIEQFQKAKLTRELSDEEIAFLKDFEKNLEEAEDIVMKEIKKVSKK